MSARGIPDRNPTAVSLDEARLIDDEALEEWPSPARQIAAITPLPWRSEPIAHGDRWFAG